MFIFLGLQKWHDKEEHLHVGESEPRFGHAPIEFINDMPQHGSLARVTMEHQGTHNIIVCHCTRHASCDSTPGLTPSGVPIHPTLRCQLLVRDLALLKLSKGFSRMLVFTAVGRNEAEKFQEVTLEFFTCVLPLLLLCLGLCGNQCIKLELGRQQTTFGIEPPKECLFENSPATSLFVRGDTVHRLDPEL